MSEHLRKQPYHPDAFGPNPWNKQDGPAGTLTLEILQAQERAQRRAQRAMLEREREWNRQLRQKENPINPPEFALNNNRLSIEESGRKIDEGCRTAQHFGTKIAQPVTDVVSAASGGLPEMECATGIGDSADGRHEGDTLTRRFSSLKPGMPMDRPIDSSPSSCSSNSSSDSPGLQTKRSAKEAQTRDAWKDPTNFQVHDGSTGRGCSNYVSGNQTPRQLDLEGILTDAPPRSRRHRAFSFQAGDDIVSSVPLPQPPADHLAQCLGPALVIADMEPSKPFSSFAQTDTTAGKIQRTGAKFAETPSAQTQPSPGEVEPSSTQGRVARGGTRAGATATRKPEYPKSRKTKRAKSLWTTSSSSSSSRTSSGVERDKPHAPTQTSFASAAGNRKIESSDYDASCIPTAGAVTRGQKAPEGGAGQGHPRAIIG